MAGLITDRIDKTRCVTLRHAGRLHHIGIGRTHAHTRVLILAQDLNITIIDAATGELIRQLTLDPTRDYQPTGAPKGPKRKKAPNLMQVQSYSDVWRHHRVGVAGFEPTTSSSRTKRATKLRHTPREATTAYRTGGR